MNDLAGKKAGHEDEQPEKEEAGRPKRSPSLPAGTSTAANAMA